MSKLAQNCGVHRTTICKAIKEDLGFKSFKLRCRHLLTTEQKEIGVIKGKAMLSSLKSTPHHIRFFSDEKLFTLDRSYNHQNNRWICKEPSKGLLVFRSKKPAACIVLGVISSEGDVMPPHFFPQGLKINKKVYLEPSYRRWSCLG